MRSLVALAALCTAASAQPATNQPEPAPTPATAPSPTTTPPTTTTPTTAPPAHRREPAPAPAIDKQGSEPAVAEVRAAPAKPRKPGAQLRMAGILVGTTGVVGVATGALFALSARNRADDISNAPVWNQARYDGGEMADRNAKIMFGIGGAMIASGIVMYVVGRKQASDAAHVALTPTRGGAALVWSCEL